MLKFDLLKILKHTFCYSHEVIQALAPTNPSEPDAVLGDTLEGHKHVLSTRVKLKKIENKTIN